MSKKIYITGKIEIKSTLSRLADPVDKTEMRSRGPKQIGQEKDTITVHVGREERLDMLERRKAAVLILQTGEMPGGAEVIKLKGQLTKAKNKIEKLKAEIEELKKTDEKEPEK